MTPPVRPSPARREPDPSAAQPAGPRRIHEVAAELGLTNRAIRYYEQVGLLRPARSGGAYRLYDQADVERLRSIQALRDDAGFSLADISALLSDQDAADDARTAYRATADPAERRRLLHDAVAREDRYLALLRGKVARLEAMIQAADERRTRLRAKSAEL